MNQNGIEDVDIEEDMEKLTQNLELYKQIIRDPVSFLEGIMAGEEGKTWGDDHWHVVSKALNSINLTREEEELFEEKKAREEYEYEALESEKQWGYVTVLAALILALVFLIVTFKIVKHEEIQAE